MDAAAVRASGIDRRSDGRVGKRERSRIRIQPTARLDGFRPASAGQPSIDADLRDVRVAFLCEHDTARVDALAIGAVSEWAGCRAGAVSHRGSIWAFRPDDTRAI